ncbi:dihydrolipoamide acetyltransferase family protein [Candidatus Aenigmatarchaeota archaeon]
MTKTDFKFPDVGEGITEGEVVEWLVKEGDYIDQDQAMLKMETDKAVVDIPSPRAGTILKIYHKAGDTVKVGEVLVTIGDKNDDVHEEAEKPVKEKKIASPKTASVVGELEEAKDVDTSSKPRVVEPQSTKSDHVIATPATRRLARDLSVDINKIKGTGKNDRITQEDVRKFAGEKTGMTKVEPHPAVTVSRKYDFYGHIKRIPLKGIRKAVAKNLTKAHLTTVHVSHMDDVDVTDLVALRAREKKKAKKNGIHLTFLPFIVKALIASLKEHPYLNASIDEEHEEVILKEYYNIGVAVDTPDGLIVPVIKVANEKTILDIAKELGELSEKARERKLDLGDLKGGTFTITNVGSFGGTYATPIINYPEVAILGTGSIREKPVVIDGKIQIRSIMPISLTFDHRVTDGGEAARFANKLKEYLEDPGELLIESK